MKNNCIKKALFLLIIFSSFSNIFAQQKDSIEHNQSYRIEKLTYISNGKTNVNVLKRNIDVDSEKVFSTEQELAGYAEIIKQQLVNLRLLDNIDYSLSEISFEDGIHNYELTVTFSDSKHLLILPKPGYDSNTGFELKVKMKDSNFIGLLNTFNLDFNGLYFHDDVTGNKEMALGLNFDYSLPFQIKQFQNTWDNEFTFKWTLGHEKPEFSYNTGLSFIYPFKKTSLRLDIHEKLTRNEDYDAFNDSLYFTNNEKLSYIIPITRINENKLTYTPAVEFIMHSDKDGISKLNTDLYGPVAKVHHTLSLTNYNWINNFRNGNSFSLVNSYGWNFNTEKFIPTVSLSAQYFKAFKYVSFTGSLYAFKYFNTSAKIGDKLRGIRDNQFYKTTARYALSTDTAIVINMDMPIHLFTTDWFGLGLILFGPYKEMSPAAQKIFYIPYRLFRIADFEMQFSPFIDIALTNNSFTNKLFDFKDGFYSAGAEILVYPLKWKSYVVRASVGLDLYQILFKDKLNTEWRETLPPYEIFLGLGLHY